MPNNSWSVLTSLTSNHYLKIEITMDLYYIYSFFQNWLHKFVWTIQRNRKKRKWIPYHSLPILLPLSITLCSTNQALGQSDNILELGVFMLYLKMAKSLNEHI